MIGEPKDLLTATFDEVREWAREGIKNHGPMNAKQIAHMIVDIQLVHAAAVKAAKESR